MSKNSNSIYTLLHTREPQSKLSRNQYNLEINKEIRKTVHLPNL